MNIGIDIDDTIMDTFDYLMPFVAEFFHTDVDALRARGISYSNLPEEWKKREIEFCRKYYDTVVPDTPVKPDAVRYIKRIKESGHSVSIISARDNRLYTNAYETTVKQLTKNDIVYDKLICTFDKAKACLDEKISLFIDDSVSNCISVQSVGIPTLLFTGKGNVNIDTDLTRVASWKEIYEIITAATK